jgi:hypothetical protein
MPFSRAGPAYDPAVLSMLQQAYDDACRDIGVDPHPSEQARDKVTREALATAIMDLAATGLRDPHILRERALQLTKPRRPRPAAAPSSAFSTAMGAAGARGVREAPAAGRRPRLRSKYEGITAPRWLARGGTRGGMTNGRERIPRASRTRDCHAPSTPWAKALYSRRCSPRTEEDSHEGLEQAAGP